MIPRRFHAFGIFNRSQNADTAENLAPLQFLQWTSAANCRICRITPHNAACNRPKKTALRESEKFSRSAQAQPNTMPNVTASRKTARLSANAAPDELPPAVHSISPAAIRHRH